ncbi:MAG: hypothetical protein QXG98_04665 [Candidatus Micrarchaeia archaeon]
MRGGHANVRGNREQSDTPAESTIRGRDPVSKRGSSAGASGAFVSQRPLVDAAEKKSLLVVYTDGEPEKKDAYFMLAFKHGAITLAKPEAALRQAELMSFGIIIFDNCPLEAEYIVEELRKNGRWKFISVDSRVADAFKELGEDWICVNSHELLEEALNRLK